MRKYRDYNINQPMLIAPDLKEWLPKNHVSYFISDIVEDLDLSHIYASYEHKTPVGQPPINPKLMLKIMIYGYSKGVRSSRKLEKATYEDVGFRILACDQHPDHTSIATFRTRHLKAIAGIFVQILQICQKSRLVKMGHICLDGTKMKVHAKKNRSRTYEQFLKTKDELELEIKQILDDSMHIDNEEDRKYGKGKTGDELPDHLLDRQKRLKYIKDTLEEIRREAEEKKKTYLEEKASKQQEDQEWEEKTGQKVERRPPKNLINKQVQEIIPGRRNPTDFDSHIMKEGISGGYIQGYNCQAVVDAESQIILAVDVYKQNNDKQLSVPMLKKVIENTGKIPKFMSADNGYFSERDIVKLEKLGVDPYIPPQSKDKGKRFIKTGIQRKMITITEDMKEKLQTKTGKSIYSQRKISIEPVFGQIKEQKLFRQFLLRGLDKVKAEWQLVAISMNLGKLHKSSMVMG